MNPVTVIPWDRDFLSGLATRLVENHQDEFVSLTVLFPHRRPRRYLLDKLAEDKRLPKPCLMPRILSVDELFAELAAGLSPQPLRPLTELDRVGTLHKVVLGLGLGLRGPGSAFPTEVKDFLPWGLKLSALMEELFTQGITAANLEHVQDLVMPTAASLLGSLKTIQEAYRQELFATGSSTPGLIREIVSRSPDDAVAALSGRTVLACGFHALSGSEETLLKALWKKGLAEILWHTDPAVATAPGEAHWSCEEHLRWLKAWKARVQLASDVKRSPLPSWRDKNDQFSLFAAAQAPEPSRRAKVVLHQGFDLHSQLMALRRELEAVTDSAGYAVVLPDTSMLMPVLHHLPHREVNVSMGYPLWRSPLSQLIETILRLQEGRMPGGYHWREVIALLRHPLLKLLRVGEETPLRGVFHDMEAAIRQGEKYADPRAMDPESLASGIAEEARPLLERVLAVCLTAFEDVDTPAAMAEALLGLASLLLDPEHSGNRWERFVIDAACLARLMDHVVPELGGSAISAEAFPPEAVRSMTRELLKRQRVPFEADPLSGLQVLGMLETRLLTFERVFILGASEEVLPGSPSPDPLLPDPLRQSLGLPGQRERDLAAAHTFHRLIQGAREVGVFYSSGVQPGLLDGKSVPSRYVEQLLWEEEKRAGRVIKPGEEPLRLITIPMRGVRVSLPGVENTDACRMKLSTLLRYRGVSPTMLDGFLKCPLAFFYRYLTPLEALEEVEEDGDPPALGQLVHETLQDFFLPHLGRPVDPSRLDAGKLAAMLEERLTGSRFYRQMPAHARLMLSRAARRRMEDFARNCPPCTPLELEKRINAKLETDAGNVSLTCIVDRLDQRDNGLVILDYKTGTPRKPTAKFWEDRDVWDVVDASDAQAGLSMLEEMGKGLSSIQMPLYLYAFEQVDGRAASDAAFVCLNKGGEEEPLFGKGLSPEERHTIIGDMTPRLAAFIVRMMLETPEFSPIASRACAWCAWGKVCGREPR